MPFLNSPDNLATVSADKCKWGQQSDDRIPVLHGAMGKNFQLVWRCHQLLSGFLTKGQLPRVSRQSRRSLMIRMIKNDPGGCVQISCHLPYSRGKPQKTLARTPSDEGAGREKEGIKERTGSVDQISDRPVLSPEWPMKKLSDEDDAGLWW